MKQVSENSYLRLVAIMLLSCFLPSLAKANNTLPEDCYLALEINDQTQPIALEEERLSLENKIIDLLNEVKRLHSKGDYKEALVKSESAFHISGGLGQKHELTLVSSYTLAVLHYELGHYPEAQKFYEITYHIQKQELGKDSPDTLDTANALGMLYLARSLYECAEHLLESTLKIRRTLEKTDKATLISTNNLGMLRIAQSRFGEAEILLKEALKGLLEHESAGKKDPATLSTMNNLATTLDILGITEQAKKLFEDTLELREDVLTKEHPKTIQSYLSLGIHFFDQRDFLSAKPIFEQAFKLYLDTFGENHPETLLSADYLAITYEAERQYTKARGLYQNSLKLRIKTLGKKHHDTLGNQISIARTFLAEGLTHEAGEILESTILDLENSFNQTSRPNLGALNVLARFYTLDGNFTRASEVIDKAMILRRSRAFYEQQHSGGKSQRIYAAGDIETTQALGLSVATLGYENKQSSASLAANIMLQMKGLGGEYDAALRRIANERGGKSVTLITEIQRLLPKLENSTDAIQLKAVQDSISQAELKLAALSPNFDELLKASGYEDVSESLREGSILLEYMTYTPRDIQTWATSKELHIAAVLFRRGHKPLFKPLGPLDKSLEKDIRALTSLDKKGMKRTVIKQASKSVYKRLVGSFDTLIKKATAVYLSPDDVLHRIPFGFLRTPRGIWGLEQPLHLIPTGRVLRLASSGSNDGRFVAIGGAHYGKQEPSANGGRGAFRLSGAVTVDEISKTRGGGWGPLPGAKAEVLDLSKLFESSKLFKQKVASPLTGASATEASMRAISSPPAILHLATHGGSADGGFVRDPLSQVVLGFADVNRAGLKGGGSPENDGLMRGTDISLLNLHGTSLVTLSACDTGDGARLRGEGVMSLAHAFRLAGAHNVLMTYWPVNDSTTRQFMKEFYTTWLIELERNSSASPHRALRDTKQVWSDRGDHPRHWATFALIENYIR